MKKTVKKINKLIVKKISEIVFVLIFIFLSNSLWNSKNTRNFLMAINTYKDLNYTDFKIENPIQYTMFPMSDDVAMNTLKPCVIKVINDTYTSESYRLVLKINKASTMDYHDLNIALDQSIFSLKNLPMLEEQEEYVFLLDQRKIQGEIREYEIRIWLNSLATNNLQSKNLLMHFDLIQETTKI